jgi:hypothetical protein
MPETYGAVKITALPGGRCGVLVWKREIKCRPAPRLRFDPKPSSTSFNYLLTQSQADTVSRDLFSVQPAEGLKDSLLVFRPDADSVILHADNPGIVFLARRDVYFRGDIGPPVLDGIADQVLKNIFDSRIGRQRGQRIVCNFRATALNGSAEMSDHPIQNPFQRDDSHIARDMRGLRVAEDIVDE